MDGGKECKVAGASLDKPLELPIPGQAVGADVLGEPRIAFENLSLDEQIVELNAQMQSTLEQLHKVNRALVGLADMTNRIIMRE